MLKTKRMLTIFQPVQDQANKTQDLTCLRSVVSEQITLLKTKFDNSDKDIADDYQLIRNQAVDILQQFCVSNYDAIADENEIKNKIDNLLTNFATALKNLEDLECGPLKQALKECMEYVNEMGSVDEIEDFENIKELGTFLLDTFETLQVYRKNLSSSLLSDRIALYSRQLYISYSMLVKLIQEQHELRAPIYSSKNYICNRMCYCLEVITKTIEGPNPTEVEEHFEIENHFVYKMDLVLDILNEMTEMTPEEKLDQCNELWERIEEVFSHAMVIAQVCKLSNFNDISGICQLIISEFEKLKVQLQTKPFDTMIINLFVNTLNDSLYRLEHRINVSMLTLVLETFSDPFSPLKNLVKPCGNAINAQKRSANDLNDVIEEFDQITDKTMQIGLFAIACCKNKDRVNRIRSCLASFESLETELIPAVTAFYLNPNNKQMRTSVKLLTEQWQAELNTFHRTIYLIIDCSAYCQVVLDDLQERIGEMSRSLDNLEGINQLQVKAIDKRAVSLTYQISATIDDIGRENIDEKTIKLNQELKAAIYEANTASKMLLQENVPEAQQLRVIKRCELILSVIKKLQPDLNNIINTSVSMNTSFAAKPSFHNPNNLTASSHPSLHSNVYELPYDQKSVTMPFVRTPYTVKSCKTTLSLQPANSVAKSPAEVTSLIPYIKKGRTMRLDHSIMYKDSLVPRNLENKSVRSLAKIRQHLFSRESFYQNCEEISMNHETIDLTNILDKVTTLCDTLNSSLNISSKSKSSPTKLN